MTAEQQSNYFWRVSDCWLTYLRNVQAFPSSSLDAELTGTSSSNEHGHEWVTYESRHISECDQINRGKGWKTHFKEREEKTHASKTQLIIQIK